MMSSLNKLLIDNGLSTTEERIPYREYSTSNKGCNINDPFIINETEDYVGLEYELIDFLCRNNHGVFADYELSNQSLIFEKNRYIDKFEIKIKSDSLAEEDKDEITEDELFIGTETYFFDITAGFLIETEEENGNN